MYGLGRWVGKAVCRRGGQGTYHDLALKAAEHHDGVVRPHATSRRVYHEMKLAVDGGEEARLREHGVKHGLTEKLLRTVKGKPGELGLNEIRPIRHDVSQTRVSVRRLPAATYTYMHAFRDIPYHILHEEEEQTLE